MKRIHDAGLVERFIKHPAIWPFVTDDDCGQIEDWKPVMAPHVHWLLSDDGGALFMVYPLQMRLWEAHSHVLPEFRTNTVGYYRAGMEYLKHNTQCARLLGFIPSGNYRAKRAAEAAGMKKAAVLARCCMKGGRLIDMTMYEAEIGNV